MSETVPSADPGFEDVRPVVRTGGPSNLGVWIFAAVLLVGGLLLFEGLSARRANLAAPATLPAAQTGAAINPPPPLALPPAYPAVAYRQPPLLVQANPPPARVVSPVIVAPPARPQRPTSLGPDDLASMGLQRIPPPEAQIAPPPIAPAPSNPAQAAIAGERVTAARLLNPSLTVPKGTIVAAVLETALDSSRPGGVRAIVSRDVRSFDGSHVLIPRGSRLYGEYNADVSAGQKRALIRWQRLTRPDAVVVNLDSPAADPLGRAGVEGKVDSHFLARFGSAILQSVLNIGVGLATRTTTANTLVVGLPGTAQQVAGPVLPTGQVQPTLRVQQGTSVSVFVNRDLDFSTVDG